LSQAPFFSEADTSEGSDGSFVPRPRVKLDAMKVEMVEEVADQQAEGFRAVTLAPQILFADRDANRGRAGDLIYISIVDHSDVATILEVDGENAV